ncbi:MAG TPA: extensin family protein [Polyangiaceae bacterium]|jgi:hypothetical protein|nr:extensin family protein [Polyangiaceae bacterium]
MLRGWLRSATGLLPALLLALSTSAAAGSGKAKPRAKPARSAKVVKAKPSSKKKGQAVQRRRATSRLLEVPPPSELEAAPAYRYANFSNDQAYEELDRRGILYRKEAAGPDGVRAPIRLQGPLHGVEIHSSLLPAERSTSQFEVLDARLAMALDDFCALLEREGIVELVHFTMYRPGASPAAESDALPTRHPGGLAIDVGALRHRDGGWLDVGTHWRADVGARTCGPGAKTHTAENTRALVSLVCEAAGKHLFHYMLTPHYDRAHHDHLHLEIKPGAKWFLVN